MRKIVPIALFSLLFIHVLAYVLVWMKEQKQLENELLLRLSVYQSVDSLVEFQIAEIDSLNERILSKLIADGFDYKEQHYAVISLERKYKVLCILGLKIKRKSVWQIDLLPFLSDYLAGSGFPNHRQGKWLKWLLGVYLVPTYQTTHFLRYTWNEPICFADNFPLVLQRALSIHSPPPDTSCETM